MADVYKKNVDVIEVLARNFEAFDYDGKTNLARNIELELNLKPNAIS